MGIEFQETYLAVNQKNTRTINSGMVFNVWVGFQNLELKKDEAKDAKNKMYSQLYFALINMITDILCCYLILFSY